MGRESIRLEIDKIGQYIKEKSILVTGPGGSIGSELCRQIARFYPKNIILLDNTENNLYQIDLELQREFPYLQYSAVLGNVVNQAGVRRVFSKYKPDTVF